ncbi:lysoplasmalogenase [Streptomyces sp. NPDC050704]|uniref:lysoplasmalogenase n=1 Tax=Streptomyces sp. NPDC050704 TaxID=3157219 RepID=UPI0034497DF6
MSPRHARVLLVSFGLVVVVDLVSLATGHDTGHTLAKPLLMPLLAAYVRVRGGPRFLVAALLFGWGGDVLLLSDAEPAFLAGMASFAAGHVCYLLLFRQSSSKSTPRARGTGTAAGTVTGTGLTAVAYAVALVVTVVLLWPGLPTGLRGPVVGYSLLLTAMAYGATRLGPVAGLGGVLFLASDTLIASGVAEWPQLPRPDFWIMLTYTAAQYLLVRGVMEVSGARPAGLLRASEVTEVTNGSAPAAP